ncbi:hypothetical protein CLIB1444_01S08284 [[Candida] jaroonii]|uniref:Uncharacterized protein n=1 Tax=[Candida] jaroonii TaxID=467808 RepID=A0ACA9Y0Q0_9ASCO|nr:hypothetical protein CLIB1444_01S08284 [[Candida] jaroonii]
MNQENYFDVSIKSKRKPNNVPLKRHSSANNLSNEFKRPGDYYIQKLSSSSLNLSKRPISGDSIVSLNSNYSDDINSINSEIHDSRLSSLTSNSIIISPNNSPQITGKLDDSIHSISTIQDLPNTNEFSSQINTVVEDPEEREEILESNETVATLPPSKSNSSLSNMSPNTSFGTPLKSVSTTTLSRTKTKYLSQQEFKTRQKLRKQAYDDSYNEDEILSNDIDLVFNVPVIKNQSELYLKKNLRTDFDDKYKPFPLPGKLRSNSTPNIKTIHSSSNLSINSSVSSITYPNDHNITNESIIEEDSSSFEDGDEDSMIISNISNYYNERSKSYSKLMKKGRQDNLMYKLPSFVKSQSSLDDLNLMSLEKLTMIDQTRPINLPPKNSNDIMKHNKELQKILNDLHDNELKDFKDHDEFRTDWVKLFDNLLIKLSTQKNFIRKLNWDSNCIEEERLNYFMKILFKDENTEKIDKSFHELMEIYNHLNESIKTNRILEFNKIFQDLINKPLFHSLNLIIHKQEFLDLMFLLSLDNNLHKHDEIFLIPITLILFPETELIEKFKFLRIFNEKIFNKELILNINENFELWSTKLPKKVRPFLNNFNLKEFHNLNFLKFLEILLQLNDKLPLSISASNPSTPILKNNIKSCNLEIIYKFLQLLIIYSVNSTSKNYNQLKIFQSFLMVLIKYYHINWNDFNDLIKLNKSIKINFNMDQGINLTNFVDKWRNIFHRL